MYPASCKSHCLTISQLISSGAIVMALTLATSGASQSANSGATKIKHIPIRYVSPASGEQMYAAYCAPCHGTDGKGNAAAAAALSQPPTDLTLLSVHNAGEYPGYRVRDLLLDQDLDHDRATDSMPVWVPAFKSLQTNHPELVGLRVHNLVAYLKTMQAPPVKAGTDQRGSANPR